MRYQLDVVALSATDIVPCAGGWLLDRVMAGWDVTAFVVERDDARALRILGVEALELDLLLSGPQRHPNALAASAKLFMAEEKVKLGVREALECCLTEVMLWGEHSPSELGGLISVHHQLSSAARAFKAQALIACGISTQVVDATETFRKSTRDRSTAAADLIARIESHRETDTF